MTFLKFAAAANEAMPTLPLVHTTDWYDFRSIRNSGEMNPVACPVYGEDLLYFFYGRPCYRKHLAMDPVSLGSLHLVSLIFDASTLPTPRRVMPFDSGAFRAGLYAADLHPGMELTHFELEPTLSAAARAVTRFYETNVGYFRSKVRKDVVHDCDDLEVESYLSIVATLGKSVVDDRRSAIEVQIADVVRLSTSKVLAVILPEQFLDHPHVDHYIRSTLGAEPLGYYCPHARPAEDARAIMGETSRFYKARGLL